MIKEEKKMFCQKCGAQLPDGSAFCTSCGAPTGSAQNPNGNNQPNNPQGGPQNYGPEGDFFSRAESSLGSEINSFGNTINGSQNYYNGARPLRTDRSLIVYILLSLITCGIYGYWFIYQLAQDVNTACQGDNEKTAGLVAYIVFSFLTCGIYQFYWMYKIGNRLSAKASYYGIHMPENGTTILMWLLFGSLLCGFGAIYAHHILFKNTNIICGAYNREHGFI